MARQASGLVKLVRNDDVEVLAELHVDDNLVRGSVEGRDDAGHSPVVGQQLTKYFLLVQMQLSEAVATSKTKLMKDLQGAFKASRHH
ncbi:hypothetical protein PHYPSEUDO_011961 [Phytophthora pseudosyringae]|uniref:Uncharacterized protein n=1 Tax=Phytophthora pseudosyringae TaxID=221518 RepID=A0A8T1V897_9STRA|nr:hypothetical protein PHYPSEUDO_011961 [Phytophthora pseudosyringae]